MEVIFDIYKEEVYTEVAQTTSYAGAKMDDENVYDRIFTTDEDRSQLERFWDESCAAFNGQMKRFLTNDSGINELSAKPKTSQADATGLNPSAMGTTVAPGPVAKPQEIGRRFTMNFSESFDTALIPGMERELFSFFVINIIAKWYGFTNKAEAGEYAERATALLERLHRKACHKRKPQRPIYKD